MSDIKQGRRGQNRGVHINPEVRPVEGRIPMSGMRQRMNVPEKAKDPNYYYYWFNDVNDDISRAKMAGFEHVNTTDLQVGRSTVDSAKSDSSVVSMNVGQGVIAYLMRQLKTYRDEDKALMDAVVNSSEESLLNSRQEGRYGDIKIT